MTLDCFARTAYSLHMRPLSSFSCRPLWPRKLPHPSRPPLQLRFPGSWRFLFGCRFFLHFSYSGCKRSNYRARIIHFQNNRFDSKTVTAAFSLLSSRSSGVFLFFSLIGESLVTNASQLSAHSVTGMIRLPVWHIEPIRACQEWLLFEFFSSTYNFLYSAIHFHDLELPNLYHVALSSHESIS
jgi:hypothetical protein